MMGESEAVDLLDGVVQARRVHHPIVDVREIRMKGRGATEDATGVQVAADAAKGDVGDKAIAKGHRHVRGGWVGCC